MTQPAPYLPGQICHLELPVSVIKVLISDLVDSGQLMTRSPIPSAELPDIQILQEVLDGLRARL